MQRFALRDTHSACVEASIRRVGSLADCDPELCHQRGSRAGSEAYLEVRHLAWLYRQKHGSVNIERDPDQRSWKISQFEDAAGGNCGRESEVVRHSGTKPGDELASIKECLLQRAHAGWFGEIARKDTFAKA